MKEQPDMNIERDIPVPTDRHRKKWEFDTMTEGDSTFLPGQKINAISTAARYYRAKVFTCRQRIENVDGVMVAGIRVWCLGDRVVESK
jgi:hypothetical protein